MSRFRIVVQYDGTGFRGWQLQKNDRTIQGELEKSLMNINDNIMIRVHGAGRTDTGVHATGQVGHFDLKTDLDPGKLKNALNGHLPKDIKGNFISLDILFSENVRFLKAISTFFPTKAFKIGFSFLVLDLTFLFIDFTDLSLLSLTFFFLLMLF